MKTRRYKPVIAAAIAGSLCSTALAANWEGDALPAPAHTDWFNTENWDTGVVPGVGVTIGENVTFASFPIAKLVDIGATNVSVGVFQISGNNDDVTYSGSGTITATNLNLGTGGGNSQPDRQTFDADLIIGGDILVQRKNTGHVFNGSVSAGGLDLGQGTTTFNGPLTMTGANGLEVYYKSISIGGGPVYELNDTLTAAGGAIWSTLATVPAKLTIGAANTLSGLSDVLEVDANGVLDLAVGQTGGFGTGSISVNQYGLLIGDTGTATWGPGNNIDVTTDAILATTAGSTPTTGDIGAAVAWQGVTSSGTWTAGNDGTSVFKGLAVGGFNGNLSSTTLQAPAGAGDVEILVLPGLGTFGQSADIVSLDGTGKANLHCVGNFQSNGGTLNPSALANAVTNFNFIGESSDTTQMVNLYNNFTVDSSQTINISGAGWAVVDPDNMDGTLTFSGSTQLAASADVFPAIDTNPNTLLTFNDLTSLAIESAEVALLEDLTPAQIVTTGTPILTLQTGGSNAPATISPQFDINATETPNLIEFMKKCNVNVQGGNNNYADLEGEGLIIADGKYLIGYSDSHKGIYLRAAAYDVTDNPYGPAVISGVAGAATMGIACASNNGSDYLGVIIPVDAKGAKLLINSDADLTGVKSGNARFTGPGNQTVQLQGPITNTPEIEILNDLVTFGQSADATSTVSVPSGVILRVDDSGTAQIDVPLTVGTIAGDGNVNGASNLTFGAVSPGDSVGALNLNTFTMTNGATYNCEISGNGGAPGGFPLDGTDNDVIDGDTVTFDTAWTLNLVNTGLSVGDLNGTEIFTIIAAGSIVDL